MTSDMLTIVFNKNNCFTEKQLFLLIIIIMLNSNWVKPKG